jgi:proteasome lid subunit RPN8/RPN11
MMVVAGSDLKRLLDAAEDIYPNEACALLVGRRYPGLSVHVTRVEISRNVADNPARRFEVDPGLRIGLERELRGGSLQVIGVWHSHPDGLPEPSATDRESVLEPHLFWLVTAVAAGQAAQTGVYYLSDWTDAFCPLPLVIVAS